MLALVAGIVPNPARAQTSATVAVNAATSRAAFPAAGVGVNTAVWNANLMDSVVPGLAHAAGITALRYPGGSTADIYNWQTNSIVPGQGSYANPSNGFDAFMGLANKVGATPVITVNYGSNAAGNGGGTPALAAAWVQYANVTHAYGVKYWEIGNEIYGNGEYGASWETDLHAAHDPTTYGANVALFAAAMKAADPTIKVGAVLAAPGNWPDGQKPDWNSSVLAQCGSKIDFVIVHWYPQSPGQETDAGLLAAPQNGVGGSPGIAAMMTKLKALIAQYGGQNAANIQVLVTETNSVSSNPGKQTTSVVNALFVSDTLMTWLENGAVNVDVWDLFNGATNGNASSSLYGTTTYGDYGILASGGGGEPAADTPLPTYYGVQMLSDLGKPGDTVVSATSSSGLLATHAVLQAGGNLALLLINKDPANTTTAQVAVAGFTPASTATVYRYGEAGGSIAASSITGVGASFSVATAPYSLTVVVLTPNQVTAPSFSLAASPASLSVQPSASASTTVAVTPAGGFTGSVTFAISGVPAGVTATFSPVSAAASSTLTLSAASTAAAGTSVMTITGTSGTLSAKTTVSFSVTAAQAPSFALSANPAALSVTQGGTATAAIAVAPANGFAGSVALTASGLPSGVTASLNPASPSAAGTLTLTAGATAATGSGTITITGTSGSLTNTLALPLTVAAAGTSGGPATFSGTAGANGPWFDEDDVSLATSAQITALLLTITVPASNVVYGGSYDTIGSQIGITNTTGANLVYTYKLSSGQVIYPGNWTFAAQMDGNGVTHGLTGDTWVVSYTTGGATYTQSGKF